MRKLLKTLRYYDLADVFAQYKAQVLPTLEFSTPAVYHCTAGVLEELDRVQQRFLHAVGVSPEEALLRYNLAPLQTRRDIAMLGVLHRTTLGQGTPQFAAWFFLDTRRTPAYRTRRQERLHSKQLYNWLSQRDIEILRRTVLGQVRVYNELPQEAVDLKTVKDFQTWLQDAVKNAASKQEDNWEHLHNLRKRSWQQVRARP